MADVTPRLPVHPVRCTVPVGLGGGALLLGGVARTPAASGNTAARTHPPPAGSPPHSTSPSCFGARAARSPQDSVAGRTSRGTHPAFPRSSSRTMRPPASAPAVPNGARWYGGCARPASRPSRSPRAACRRPKPWRTGSPSSTTDARRRGQGSSPCPAPRPAAQQRAAHRAGHRPAPTPHANPSRAPPCSATSECCAAPASRWLTRVSGWLGARVLRRAAAASCRVVLVRASAHPLTWWADGEARGRVATLDTWST